MTKEILSIVVTGGATGAGIILGALIGQWLRNRLNRHDNEKTR